jgi:hypothetical protein
VSKKIQTFTGRAFIKASGWKQGFFVVKANSKADCVRRMEPYSRSFSVQELNSYWTCWKDKPFEPYDNLAGKVIVTFPDEIGVWQEVTPQHYERLEDIP